VRAASTTAGRVALLVAALSLLVLVLPGRPTVLAAVAGLLLLFGVPTVLWFGAATRVVSTRDGAALLALGGAVLGDMLVGLLVNTVLPPLGVARPLERIPLAVAFFAAALLIGVAGPAPAAAEASEAPAGSRPRSGAGGLRRPGVIPVAALGALAVVLAVAGAIRLNNGLGRGVSLTALVVIAVLLLVLMLRHRVFSVAVLELGIFLASAALLLLVSLRGWNITGHDIQSEYKVFTVALDAGRWHAGSAATAYNACLSITILPVSVVNLTGIAGVYVFKVVLPLLFAVAPVLVHRSVRNVGPSLVAVMSAAYFILFPTFFTDMTYLGRQEVAFVLLGCVMLVITDSGRPLARRRAVVMALMAGIVISHYSTTYVMVGTFVLAWLADLLWRLVERYRGRRARGGGPADGRTANRGFVTWWIVAFFAGLAALWTGPVTHSGNEVRTAVSGTLAAILHPERSQSTFSSDTSYSLLGRAAVSPAVRLSQYRAVTLVQTAPARSAGRLLPLDLVNRYPTVALDTPNLPLTGFGRAIEHTGVNVASANDAARAVAARLLQVLLLIGLVVTFCARRTRAIAPNRDFVTLAIGSVVVTALLTALPELSVDYGVLRAFQQGLFFCAPFIVVGSLWLFHRTWRAGAPLAYALATTLFLDLTGVLPALTGGYPAQLHLANAGQYYDLYYTQPAEVSAAQWAQRQIDQQQLSVATQLQTDLFTFLRLQTALNAPALQDNYPTLVGTHTYVLLGTSTVAGDRATLSTGGVLATYLYPVGLLDTGKNEIYSSEGAEVYR